LITILFWNLAKNESTLSHLECLIRSHTVDILLLAEYPRNPGKKGLQSLDLITESLKLAGRPPFQQVNNLDGKVVAFTSLHPNVLVHRMSTVADDLGVWTLKSANPAINEIIIGGVHFMAKTGVRDISQAYAAKEIIDQLTKFEDERGHQCTLLIGDFNMHPYDDAMTNALGIPAYMTAQLAYGHEREYRKRSRRRFYNPMWGFFGDRTPGPAGTYYWRDSALHNTYWTLFDQVLLRPHLIDTLVNLRILEEDGVHSLVAKDGAPDANYLSDHLPILATFQL
jgi:hypothetical protein